MGYKGGLVMPSSFRWCIFEIGLCWLPARQ